MPTPTSRPSNLRRDVRLANYNAGLWAFGAGLAPTLVMVFFAIDLRAPGLTLSWVLAAPRFAGLLRLFVPTMIGRLGSRKRLVLVSYAASSLVLTLLPWLVSPQGLLGETARLRALVVLWGVYQVLEYFGTTAFWSWLGDLYPQRVRGRLVGVRERWLVSGRMLGMLVGFGVATAGASMANADWPPWWVYIVLISFGGVMMVASLIPLSRMQDLPAAQRVDRTPWRAMVGSLRSAGFAGLLLWSVGLSIANNISAAARKVYQTFVLEFEYKEILPLLGLMYAGQYVLAPRAGRWTDRLGGRRVLFWSQSIVAASPLFFLFATPGTRWLIAGAFVAWIAYGAMNVGLDTMKINLAPQENNAPALSLYYAAADLASGVTILLGGVWLESITESGRTDPANCTGVLLTGFALRVVVGLAALRLPKGYVRSR